jgi:hypothetical protein
MVDPRVRGDDGEKKERRDKCWLRFANPPYLSSVVSMMDPTCVRMKI